MKLIKAEDAKKIIISRLWPKIERMVKVNLIITAEQQIAKNIQEHDKVPINGQTVRNFLHMNQYKACAPRNERKATFSVFQKLC